MTGTYVFTVMHETFLSYVDGGSKDFRKRNRKKKAAGHRKTNPGEKWLPKSNPYFFIYGPGSDIFTTLPPTMKFSCYILPRNA